MAEKKKDSCWNELQEFCIENREENIIALAPTGMGKTEAGLLWIGNHKGFLYCQYELLLMQSMIESRTRF